MPKTKHIKPRLISYKRGYDPDSIKNTKSVEFNDAHGDKRTISIPVVSGAKPVEFQVNEQMPLFFELATARNYTGLQKFTAFGEYLSGTIKNAWENELQQNFSTNNTRTNPGFLRAVLATWKRFYGQQDLRKAGLKYIANLEWDQIYRKTGDTPVKFTQRVETLYAVLKELDEYPGGTTPLPTVRQRKEFLVESFPKDYQVYYEGRGGDFSESFAAIGQILQDHFNREHESDTSDSSCMSSDSSSDSGSDSSDSDSDSEEGKKKKRKSKKVSSKAAKKKSKKQSKKKSKKKSKSTTPTKTAFSRPTMTDICPIHGGHTWGDCRLNNRGANYDPPKAYVRANGGPHNSQGRGRSAQNQHGNRDQQGQQSFHYDDDVIPADERLIPVVPSPRTMMAPLPRAPAPTSSYANVTWGPRSR